MNKVWFLWLVVLLAGLSGCAQKTEQFAENHLVLYKGLPALPPGAENVLVRAFLESPVPWDEGNKADINGARDAINSMGKFMESKLQLNGSVPYYTYKTSTEYVYNQYMILQRGLDARTRVEGAISEQGLLCYELVKQRIVAELSNQRDLIAAETGKINEMATQDTVEQFKKAYHLIKPLIGIAL